MPYAGTHTFVDGTVMHCWLLNESSQELARLCQQERLPHHCEARAESRRQELLGERLLLKHMLGVGVELQHNADRLPYLSDYQGYLSVAHTRGFLGIAFNRDHAMGIDVERYGRRVLNVRNGFLSENEKNWLQPTDEMGHLVAWTGKEAIFKTIGERALVKNYRDEIVLHPFITPQVGESLQHHGAFVAEDFYLCTMLDTTLMLTFACAHRHVEQSMNLTTLI